MGSSKNVSTGSAKSTFPRTCASSSRCAGWSKLQGSSDRLALVLRRLRLPTAMTVSENDRACRPSLALCGALRAEAGKGYPKALCEPFCGDCRGGFRAGWGEVKQGRKRNRLKAGGRIATSRRKHRPAMRVEDAFRGTPKIASCHITGGHGALITQKNRKNKGFSRVHLTGGSQQNF